MIPRRSPASRARRAASKRRARIRGNGPFRSRRYLTFLKFIPCLACYPKSWRENPSGMSHARFGYSDPAHIGGMRSGKGMSQKGSDLEAVPLCRQHHNERDHVLTAERGAAFLSKYGIDKDEVLAALHSAFCLFYPKAAKRIPGLHQGGKLVEAGR